MAGVLLRRSWEDPERHTHRGKRPHEDRGRKDYVKME